MSEKNKLADEEIAAMLVEIYFEEVARHGFKRSLDLDAIVNAYLYTLNRLKTKDQQLQEIVQMVKKEEEKLSTETKEEMFPQ
ncbi:MAG: hypothetical protein V1494_06600 [Candidatus Diapherotrites archaeon]